MIELRWIEKRKPLISNSSGVSYPIKILQYRQSFAVDASGSLCPGDWSPWEDVQLVLNEDNEDE